MRATLGRSGLPVAPPEVKAEVELYAREHGRTATVHFVPFGGWFVEFSLRPNDKRLKLYQEGRAEAPPTERVWLNVPNPRAGQPGPGGREPQVLPLDLYQLGPSGVREFLERGNTWSGRGQYRSQMDALKQAETKNAEQKVKLREQAKEASRHEQRDKRRWRFRIPFLSVRLPKSLSRKETP